MIILQENIMPNISDYLEWRCDIPFAHDPFNDVDNLILAELSYTHFDGAVPADGKRTPLRKVYKTFFEINSREKLEKSDDMLTKTAFLMDGMMEGRRFSGTQISDYVDIVDTDRDMQMSAVTFILEDGTAYIAFRGTDNTVVGWKEDFNMSYLPETGGQREAVAYLNRVGKKLRRPIRVGGHSKGGNFAVYASAFCDKSVRDRIIAVYSNDAPGFRREVTESEEYRAVIEKVKSIVPESSVIGLLLSSEAAHKYMVASSVKGMLQHDGMTWQVKRNEFVRTEQSDFGRFIKDTQKDWLSRIDDRSREKYVNTLFSLLEATGADTFSEMKGQKLKSLEQILNTVRDMPDETQKLMLEITGELIGSGGRTIMQALADLKQDKEDNK